MLRFSLFWILAKSCALFTDIEDITFLGSKNLYKYQVLKWTADFFSLVKNRTEKNLDAWSKKFLSAMFKYFRVLFLKTVISKYLRIRRYFNS